MAMADFLSTPINGIGDDTQPRARKPRAAAAPPSAGAFQRPATAAPDDAAPASGGGIFKNGTQPVGPTGEYLPHTDETDRLARTGGSTTFDPKAPSSLERPTVFNPTGPSVLNPLGAPSYARPGVGPVNATPPPAQSPITAIPPPAAAAAPAAVGPAGKVGAALASTTPGAAPGAADAAFASNAPGTAVINGRVVSPDEIAKLSNRNVISSENFTRPNLGVAMSQATGGALTPTVGQFARPGSAAPTTVDDGAADVQAAQRGAQSDIVSIANEDPRSALGIAARNLRISVGSKPGARTSKYGTGLSPYEQGIGAMLAAAQQPVTDAQQRSLANTREGGEIARANINADTQRFDTMLKRPPGQNVQTDDGAGILGPDGVIRPALDANGKPVKNFQAVGIEKPAIDTQGYAKVLDSHINRLLGVDPLTGTLKDPKTGQQRQPTPQELAAATEQAHAMVAPLFGMSAQQARAAAAPAANAAPPEAVAMLKKNPALREQFEMKYGKGSAAAALGG